MSCILFEKHCGFTCQQLPQMLQEAHNVELLLFSIDNNTLANVRCSHYVKSTCINYHIVLCPASTW